METTGEQGESITEMPKLRKSAPKRKKTGTAKPKILRRRTLPRLKKRRT